MIINDIDFPRDILEAISNDSLVVFAGAGVSVDAPTNLPDFVGLTQSIAKQCGEVFNREEDKIDEFLGDLQRKNIKVKELVAKRLMQGKPQPNKFHYNILNLFNNSDSIRIVTTNQDCMFEAATEKRGWVVPVFNSPAVPYWPFVAPNDTTGIITNIMMKIIYLQPVEDDIPTWFANFVKKIVLGSENIEEFICVVCQYAT